jgi:hypothetical protein
MTKFGIRALIALTIFVAGLSGCSQEGTLVTIDPSKSYETSVYIGKSLAVIGPDHFPVVVSGFATTKRSFSEEVDVKSGETTTYQIADDTGALIFTNMHLRSVNEIAARPCDSLTFGPNLLEAKRTIPPGSTRTIQLDAGCWDLQINYDPDATKDVVDSVLVRTGKIDTINWEPGYVFPTPVPPAPGR